MADQRREVAGATIVITGASSGFGRGTAIRLAELGANVVLAARRTAVLEQLAAEIGAAGGSALAVTTDVSQADQVTRLADTAAARFGSIDIWINNVGVGALGLFWQIPLEDHARLVDVNLKSVIFGSHEAIRRFRAQGFGTLINLGSVDSHLPMAYQSTYAATKAAVLSLGRSLNEELRLAGIETIRVATLLPWAVDTPWWTHAANYTGHAPRMAAMDDPEIVVDAIVRACTDPHEEQAIGIKAKASKTSCLLFPNLTERMSADVANREIGKAVPAAASAGALHQPVPEGVSVEGGIRARMQREDSGSRPYR